MWLYLHSFVLKMWVTLREENVIKSHQVSPGLNTSCVEAVAMLTQFSWELAWTRTHHYGLQTLKPWWKNLSYDHAEILDQVTLLKDHCFSSHPSICPCQTFTGYILECFKGPTPELLSFALAASTQAPSIINSSPTLMWFLKL